MPSSDAAGGSTPEIDDDTLVMSGFTPGAFFAERYRLEKLLGAGAMGKVFRATDAASGVPVAIKVLHADTARKPVVLERFRREAEILRGLGHPGVVRVLHQGRSTDGVDFLVMELLEGRTLKERMRADGPLSPAELLPFLVTICDAVGAAHQQGIVHRDLKPDNVFLVESERPARVKILDFGLGRLVTNERITATGVMMGTPRYMAPEQIRSAKDADARTDIYACGVLVHEALTGASPFPAEDQGQLLGCVIEGRVLPLEDVRPDLPAALGPVVRRAMAKDPKDRYATIGAFAEAFAAAIGGSTGRSSLPNADALFADVDGAPRFSAPSAAGVDAPRAADPVSGDYGPPRFTHPPSAPGVARRVREAPRPKSRGAIWIVLFALALGAVIFAAAGAALGLRGCMRWLEKSGVGAVE